MVGAIGVATCGIAAYRGVAAGDARRALSHAVERGVDLIDVAADPEIERMVGDIVRELRARDRATVVAPVAATVSGPTGTVPAGRGDRLHRALPVGAVQHAIESTLRGTRLDVVPVAVIRPWFDDWLDDPAWPELRDGLARLAREGKALWWGVSAADPADAVRAAADPAIAIVATEHHVFDRRAEAALIPAAREHDTGVIVRAPLAGGALGGELGPGVLWKPGDARAALWPPERLAELAIRLARLAEHVADPPAPARTIDAAREALEAALAARRAAAVGIEARTVAELALRATLTWTGAPVVAGMRTRDHVDANLAAGDGRALSAALLARLAEFTPTRPAPAP